MKENYSTWQPIKGYPDYEISNFGDVCSNKFNKRKRLKQLINNRGYYYVGLSNNKIRKTFYIHRLVANTFIPNSKNKPEVNHLDGNKLNNQVTNLEWVTHKQNVQHGWKTGLCKANKKPIYSKKLDLKFESVTEAANYVQTYYFEDTKLTTIQSYICMLLKNKTTNTNFDYGWEYVNK